MTTWRQAVNSDAEMAERQHANQRRYNEGIDALVKMVNKMIDDDIASVRADPRIDEDSVQSIVQYNAQVIVIDIARTLLARFHNAGGNPIEVTQYLLACSKHAMEDYADFVQTQKEMQ